MDPRETVEARGTKWNFDVEMDSGISGPHVTSRPDQGMPTATAREEIPTVAPPAPPPEEHVPEIRVHSNSGGGDVAAKTKMVIYDPTYADPAKTKVIGKVVRYTNILEVPIPDLLNEDGKLIETGQIIIAQKLQECKNDIYGTMVSWGHCVTSKDRYITIVSTAEEAKRGIVGDPDTRPLDPSSSSTDPNPKRSKTTSVTNNENLANRMDEDNFQRGPATSHQLEPVDDENESKKARVARNVLHIRGEDSMKFDVNEEAWPNADLAIRASYESALVDGLAADKVKAGDEREIQ